MSKPLLTAVILLLLAAATAASSNTNKVVECSGEAYTVDTTDVVTVSLSFESIAPVFVSDSPESRGNLLYMSAGSARWDGPLEFEVVLDHYAPRQQWVIGVYTCTLKVNGTVVDTRTFEVLEAMPQRIRTVIKLAVPATAASYGASNSTKVSKPLRGTYCEKLPNADSWPNCPKIRPPDNTVSVFPPSWNALEVNGRRAGEVVKGYGVNATIPNPWGYGVRSNVGTFSYVAVDGRRYGPEVYGVPVDSYVELYMVGMPKLWGSVKLRDVSVPVYVTWFMHSSQIPTDVCRPPSCIVLAWLNYSRICPTLGPHYRFVAAVQSGAKSTGRVEFIPGGFKEIYLPLGSVYLARVAISWTNYKDIVPTIASDPFLRVVVDGSYYEKVAGAGKVNGPLATVRGGNRAYASVAVAVDLSVPSIQLGLYARPAFSFIYPSDTIITKFTYLLTCSGKEIETIGRYQWSGELHASLWLTDALLQNYPDISLGRHPDLLNFLYGEPTVYYWGNGDRYGMVSVHTDRRETSTTADDAGQSRLYYVTGVMPTDATAVYVLSLLEHYDPNSVSNPGPWLVWVVPTAACRSAFCAVLNPEVLGPLPPVPGDRTLPDAGYSFVLMYTGEKGRHRVSVYVEDGYVISLPPLKVSRARNYKLVEIDKEWEPFEAVIVGPGWWVPYRRLGPCETMPLSVSAIYATPERTGPVKVVVEDNGARYNYTFYVTSDVKYRITTRTPAPASLASIPFNITVRVALGGVPYAYGLGGVLLENASHFHYIYGFGEGGRLAAPVCTSTQFVHFRMSQLVLSGDFWGTLGLAHMPLKPVQIRYIYTRPRLELVEPWRGLVKVKADGPVAGFAFYARRGGAWVKIGEVSTKMGNEYRGCLLVNVSKIFPWDPILVLPLVEQELTARPGDEITIWRPETALLFKTWADVVGYPKGARSVLEVVRTC